MGKKRIDKVILTCDICQMQEIIEVAIEDKIGFSSNLDMANCLLIKNHNCQGKFKNSIVKELCYKCKEDLHEIHKLILLPRNKPLSLKDLKTKVEEIIKDMKDNEKKVTGKVNTLMEHKLYMEFNTNLNEGIIALDDLEPKKIKNLDFLIETQLKETSNKGFNPTGEQIISIKYEEITNDT